MDSPLNGPAWNRPRSKATLCASSADACPGEELLAATVMLGAAVALPPYQNRPAAAPATRSAAASAIAIGLPKDRGTRVGWVCTEGVRTCPLTAAMAERMRDMSLGAL